MGLLVVARLAARHGIRVRLNEAEFGGLTALVWFPDEILTHYSAAAGPGRAAEQRGAAVGPAAYAPPRTQEAPAAQTDLAWSARSAQAMVPVGTAAAVRTSARPDIPSGDVGVVLPQAESQTRTAGLPIFDEVESRWSRGGREAAGPAVPGSPAGGQPRRPSAATQDPRAFPGTQAGSPKPNRSGAPGRQGWVAPAEEANPRGQDES